MPDGNSLFHALRALKGHEHLGLMYRTEEERHEAVAAFLKVGQERHERGICLTETADTAGVRERLLTLAPELNGAFELGEIIVEQRAVFCDPGLSIFEALESAFDEAKEAGYSAVRITGDLGAMLRTAKADDAPAAFRRDLDRFFHQHRATGMCQYRVDELSAERLFGTIGIHPYLVFERVLCRNHFYTLPVTPGASGAGPAEQLLAELKARDSLEQALKASEEKYRLIIDQAAEIIVLADLEGHLIEVNQKAVDRLGYSLEELQGMRLSQLWPEDELPQLIGGLHQVERDGEGRLRGLTLCGKDGTRTPVDLSATLFEMGGKKIFKAVLTDAAAREEYESALHESENLYRQMFERNLAVKLLIDPATGDIVDANQAAADFYGYPAEDLRRMKITHINLLPAEEVEREMERARTERRTYFNFPHRRANGEIRDVEVYSGPVIVGGRTLLHSIIHDITERKRAEKALRENENRYRTLVALLPDPLIIQADGYIRFANQAALTAYGAASEEDLIGRQFLDLVHPDFRQTIKDRSPRTANAGMPLPLKREKYLRLDGTPIDVDATAMPFIYEGVEAVMVVFRDVTRQVRAEREVTLQQARLRRFAEASLEGIILHEDGLMFDVNETAARMVGYEALELIGQSIFLCIAPESKGMLRQKIAEGYEGPLRLMARRKDGSVFPVEAQGRDLLVEGRNVRVVVTRDITRQVAMETALKEAESHLRRFFEASIEGLFFHDHGKVVDANPAFAALLGYNERELSGMDVFELVAPECHSAVMGQLQDRGEAPLKLLALRKDGVRIPVEIRGRDILHRGTPMRFVTVVDISERERAAKALMESENKYRSLFNNAIDAIVIFDAGSRRMLDANPAFLKLYGYTLDEVLSMTTDDISAEPERTKTGIAQAAPGSGEAFIDLRWHRKKDGTVFPVELSAGPYDWQGTKVMFAMIRDITSRIDAERALVEAKERAEKATEVKDKFVSLVSHDLRGPLAAATGYLKMLTDDVSGEPLSTAAKEVIMTVLDSNRKMAELIDELLSASRLQSGRFMLHASFVPLRRLVEKGLAAVAYSAGNKHISLANEVADGARIYADEPLLYQVLLNLLSNAVKFTVSGGRVSVSFRRGDPAAVVVNDTGSGIPQEKIARLFSYETKTSTPGTDGETGTGLGLPLCMDIVKAQGGDIRVHSVPGEGSSFSLELPTPGPVVLAVDDDERGLELMRTVLLKTGVTVETAHSGEEALRMIAARPPHLVLSDLYMPEMDGFELIRRIKASPAWRNIPVVAITGVPGEDRERIVALGADDFITKHTIPTQLAACIAKYFS